MHYHPIIESSQTLSGFERLSCCYGNWDTFGFTVHMSGDQQILIENIRHILKQLLTAHSRMRSRIRIDHRDSSYKRIRDETALLETYSANDSFLNNDELLKKYYSIFYTDDSENEWKRLCEKGCNQNPYIDEQLTIIFPLFHFIFILNKNSTDKNKQFHMILFNNHSVSDGRSACTIINDYLTLATNNNNKLDIDIVQQPFLTDITPKSKLFNFYFWKKIFKDYNIFKQRNKSTFPIREPSSSHRNDHYPYYFLPSKSKFIFQSGTKEAYRALQQICHSKQLTMHGPLYACLLLTIQHQFLLQSEDQETIETFPVDVPCDLRKPLQLPKSIVGCYAGSVPGNTHRLNLKNTTFWSFASQCMHQAIKSLNDGSVYFDIHYLDKIVKSSKLFYSLLVKKPFYNGLICEFEFVNNGRYPHNNIYNDKIHVHGIHGADLAAIYRTTTCIGLQCVEQMDVTLMHEFTNDDLAAEFLNNYVNIVERCSSYDDNVTLHDIFYTDKDFPWTKT